MVDFLINEVSYGSTIMIAIKGTTYNPHLSLSTEYIELFSNLDAGQTEDCPLFSKGIFLYSNKSVQEYF